MDSFQIFEGMSNLHITFPKK